MADTKAQNKKAESEAVKDAGSEREVKGVQSDRVTPDDLAAKVALPQGDHVSVGGPADEVGEVEVVVSDSYVAPNIPAMNQDEQAKEIHVLTDKVVTDPTGPLGVQIPSVLVTDVRLPIHNLALGTPEQQFEEGTAKESETSIVSGE